MSAFAVIGHPIGHTMSPFIHHRLFALSGIRADYFTRDISPEELSAQLTVLLAQTRGINVTIPHKQAIIPLLTRLEGRAKIYQSVNTVAVTDEGYIGYNTDATGFLRALDAGGAPLTAGQKVAILGCGGVGRTFACEAALAGCSVVNAVRDADRDAAASLRDFVLALAPDTSYDIVGLDDLRGGFDLLINATPVGMYPHPDASPVTAAAMDNVAAVFDAVYNPRDTRLLQAAAANGAIAIGGMSMLVWQAADAQTIWLGTRFDPAAVAGVIEESLAEMERIFHG